MRRLRLLLRMLAIRRALMRHGLDEIVWRMHLFRPLAWVGKILPRRKLEQASPDVKVIHTVRGVGFRLDNDILDAIENVAV